MSLMKLYWLLWNPQRCRKRGNVNCSEEEDKNDLTRCLERQREEGKNKEEEEAYLVVVNITAQPSGSVCFVFFPIL